jgi:cell wall-associated NlpC family hydrolase
MNINPYSRVNPFQQSFSATLIRFIGTPYKEGGQSVGMIDCSGLIIQCLKLMGYLVRDRDAGEIKRDLCLPEANVQGTFPLVFLQPHSTPQDQLSVPSTITHVGALISDDAVVHAAEDPGYVSVLGMEAFTKQYGGIQTFAYIDWKSLAKWLQGPESA